MHIPRYPIILLALLQLLQSTATSPPASSPKPGFSPNPPSSLLNRPTVSDLPLLRLIQHLDVTSFISLVSRTNILLSLTVIMFLLHSNFSFLSKLPSRHNLPYS